jgi:hypothetical protein
MTTFSFMLKMIFVEEQFNLFVILCHSPDQKEDPATDGELFNKRVAPKDLC